MVDDNFATVEQLANGKKLSLVYNYHYELLSDDGMVVYWSYLLKDISNFLRNYNV